MSGLSSPGIASPSCEIRSELTFPPLPHSDLQTQQQQQPQNVQSETAKVAPKISEFSVLEEQLSRIHQKPFNQPQPAPQSPHPTYSEAVRQSPTTVQQQFPQQIVSPQVLSLPQQVPIIINSTSSPVVTVTSQNTPASAQKVSRFQVSKVEEQKQANLQQPSKPLLSPEVEVQNTNIQQVSPQPIQPSQAQAFFQQHQGGVVCPLNIFLYVLLACSFF